VAVTIRDARPADAARCHAIETAAFPAAEAAPLARIAARIAGFAPGFRLYEAEGALRGFVNSGCAWRVDMADDAFKALVGHDAAAPTAVILSLAVAPEWQGQGIGGALLADFALRMRALGKREIRLICKPRKVGYYARHGFVDAGPSASTHGGQRWQEMRRTL
jgi:predicted N-acetyltransferase YhbS